jgi:hypothetical protein
MKIKILKPFIGLNLTDYEKVFCYLMTHYFEKYGAETEYTINNSDLKILLNGKSEGIITHKTLPTELQKVLNFALYSDIRTGISLNKEAYNSGTNRYDENKKLYKIYKKDWVNIKKHRAILIYTYVMSALAHSPNDTYEGEDYFGHTAIDMENQDNPSHANRLQRKVNPVEFMELLRVTSLD